jgi:uracil-DNA glycosylase
VTEFDPGPPPALADHLAALPSYSAHRERFWYDWGPVFYRGRLDGTARLLAIASDPGPTERIAGRTLVGDAGQRVQGFLAKLGLTRSYVLVNAFAYALRPSQARWATPILSEPAQLAWRNFLLTTVTGPPIQALVAFGGQAQAALGLWAERPAVPVFQLPHPSSRDAGALVGAWRSAITELRDIVTPDPDGSAAGPTYGARLTEADYTRIPRGDLPFGVPDWLGDDAWGRTARPRHNNSVRRPKDDLLHTLVWQAPPDRP